MKQLFILIYSYRNGMTATLVFANKAPETDEEIQLILPDFEPDNEDECVQLEGPFSLGEIKDLDLMRLKGELVRVEEPSDDDGEAPSYGYIYLPEENYLVPYQGDEHA